MANPKHDRRNAHAAESTIVQDRVVGPRRDVPARAHGMRKAGTPAPQTTGEQTMVRQARKPVALPDVYDDYETDEIDLAAAEAEADVRRLPSSARRYTGMQPAIASDPYPTSYKLKKRKQGHWRRVAGQVHPLAWIGGGMLVMLLSGILFFKVGGWVGNVEEQWTYGSPPTYQIDEAVGHNGDNAAHPSHFIATDDAGRIEVFEIAPDGSTSRFYAILNTHATDGSTPSVTLKFTDVNHDGKIDMEVLIEGMPPMVCLNDGTKFGLPIAV